jgi:SRR1 protein
VRACLLWTIIPVFKPALNAANWVHRYSTPQIGFEAFEHMLRSVYTHGKSPSPLYVFRYEYEGDALKGSHSLNELMHEYRKYDDSWGKHRVSELLNHHLSLIGQTYPTKIIGFSLGSPDKDYSPTTFFQHAAMVSITKKLNKLLHGKVDGEIEDEFDVKAYSQNPQYTNTDKELLKELNVSVKEYPLGFLEVDEMTFVISIHPDLPVMQILADNEDDWPKAILSFPLYSIDDERIALQASEAVDET